MKILHNTNDNNFLEGTLSDYSNINSSCASEVFKNCVKGNRIAPIGFAGLLKADEVHNHILIPTRVFSEIRGILGDENVGDKFKVTRTGVFYRELELFTPLYEATIKKALDFFKEVKFPIDYEIKVAIFDDKHVLGTASEETIILSDICVEKGINEIVNTIIEEYIHIKYKVLDETRDFQTSIISEFITYMKTINTYLL